MTAAAKYTTVIMQLGFTMILSRILTPSEYGTVGVITVFTTFFTLLSDLGFSAGVIQNKDLTDEDNTNIFSFSLYLSVILSLLFASLSYVIAEIYNDDIYLTLCPILSLSVLFSSANMIPNALMMKMKQFKTIAIRTVVSCLVTSAVTIILALDGWGVYALCLQNVLSALMIFIWNEVAVRLKIKLFPSFSSVKKILGYSIYQYFSMFINFFCRNLDNMIIGKIFPKAELAYYNKSYTLMMMPISYIPGVINPVLHPILSEYQNDKKTIYEKYIRLCILLSTIGFIVSSACYVFGHEIIYIMFGDQWDRAVFPFRILSISLFGQLLTNTVGSIYQSLGDTKRLFHSVVITSIIILSCIVLGIIMGSIEHVSIMVSVAYVLNYFITFYILISHAFGYSFIGFLKPLKYDFSLFVALIVLISLLPNFENSWINLAARLIIYIIYCVLYLLPSKRYLQIKSIVK